MSNIHGLFSNRSNSSNDDRNNDGNNRYVGGISSRGGGSGLAVEPNPNDNPNILNAIHSNAVHMGTNHDASDNSNNEQETIIRRITMYRSGFVVDNGPYRRLDDPNNGDFLRDLARGVIPREFMVDGHSVEGLTVGLVDKRHMEYEDDDDANYNVSDENDDYSNGEGGNGAEFTSFTGVGNSLGGTSAVSSSHGGVISPSNPIPVVQHTLDPSRPTTSIQVRLLNGKRLVVKTNLDAPVSALVAQIRSSGDEGSEDYVLSSGYPPTVLEDLTISVEDAGLKGAQVLQKKA